MNEIAYYFGQTGLLIAAFSVLGVIQVVGESETRPGAYYFIALWLVGMACALTFSETIVYPTIPRLTTMAYAFRLFVGLEHACVFYFYHKNKGKRLAVESIRRVNRLVIISTTAIIFGVGLLGTYQMIMDLRQEAHDIKKTVQAATKVSDVALEKQLSLQNDSLRRETKANRIQIVRLTAVVARQGSEQVRMVELIKTLTSIAEDLKRSVKQVGANVERTRKQTSTPGRIERKTMPVEIDKSKVKTTFFYELPDQSEIVADTTSDLSDSRFSGTRRIPRNGPH